MNDFTASNGRQISAESDATRIFNEAGRNMLESFAHLDTQDMQALREFFQAEADERLGRWRWPENPDYVVYPDRLNTTPPQGAIRVWNEKTGASRYYLNRDGVGGIGGLFDPAAAAYFDAHPEPKPWHDAKDGETWALIVNGSEDAWAFREREWERVSDGYLLRGGPASRAITAGRRIWPEAVTS